MLAQNLCALRHWACNGLAAFEQAVRQAQRELSQEVGEQIAQVMALGLEAYARGYETGI